MNVSFEVPGRLIGKGRARFSTRGGFVRTYTPEKTRNMEAVIRSLASDAMDGRTPMEGPLELSLTLHLMPPPSWSKKKRNETIYVTGKPDCSNILKLVEDSLNGIAWRDDSQVAVVGMVRTYRLNGPESATVRISQLMRADLPRVFPMAVAA